jgi:RND family efflux transporter MFP subunit
MKFNRLIYISIILVAFLISACTNTTEQSTSAAAEKIVADLSTPPPGSAATQEKWDTFTDEKKKDTWDTFIADNASPAGTTPAETTSTRKPSGGSSVIPVIAAELEKAPMNLYYYGLGELKPGDEIRVAPGSAGTVASLYVATGDFVEPGDLLFSLDNSDLVNSIERSSEKWDNDLELAAIRLNEAKEHYETTNNLYTKNAVAKSELDKSQQAWEEAALNYEKIQLAKTTEIENLQENIRTTLSISPGRGYISAITFRETDQINTADYIEIIDIKKLAITVQVPENVITRIRQKQRVVAKQASAPEYTLSGVVTSIGLKADGNRTYEVTAEFDNPNQMLLPGMLMETQIQMVQYSASFVVPKVSVVNEGPNQYIYRIKDDIAEKVPVETGQSKGVLIQIDGPIKEGDLFAIQGQTYLQKGTAVKVVETREYIPERVEF